MIRVRCLFKLVAKLGEKQFLYLNYDYVYKLESPQLMDRYFDLIFDTF